MGIGDGLCLAEGAEINLAGLSESSKTTSKSESESETKIKGLYIFPKLLEHKMFITSRAIYFSVYIPPTKNYYLDFKCFGKKYDGSLRRKKK